MENNVNEAQILIVVNSLLEASADRDECVRKAVCESLWKISKVQPNIVVKYTLNYRRKNSKLTSASITHVLQLLKRICENCISDLEPTLVKQLITFSFDEMMKNTSYTSFPAADILNAICVKYCRDVMDCLLSKLQPGAVPHQSLLYAIGNIASCNLPEFVVYVNSVLINIRPIIPAIKNDSQRQLITFAMEKLCESVLENHVDKDTKISKVSSECAEKIHAVYDLFITQWAASKDVKTVEGVVSAIGPMFSLLEENRLVEQTPRTVNFLLGLYRRSPHPPRYKISEALSTVLQIAPPVPLEPMLDNIIHTLHAMVWVQPDYREPVTVKNHGEVLRCYDQIGYHFPERLSDLLIRQVRGGSEADRVAALTVISHLLGSSDSVLSLRMSDLINALHVLSDASVKVKKALVRTIVVLACKEFLGSSDELFIEFLVKHCCPLVSCNGPEWTELREVCCSTITLLSSTVKTVFPLCWKVLLRLLLAPEFTAAIFVITSALTKIADKSNLEPLNTEKFPSNNIQAVITRCIGLLGAPQETDRGISILNFLVRYSPHINDDVSTLWKLKIPQLISYLELSEYVESEWESLMLEFLDETLRVSSEEFSTNLVSQFTAQLSLYPPVAASEQRAMLLKSMAITLNHISDVGTVNAHLDVLFNPVRSYSLNDAKICARAVGIISRKHVVTVLSYLKNASNNELTRKTSRLLGFVKDWKQEVESERARATLFLCYGQLVLEAPAEDTSPHLITITNWLLTQFGMTKDVEVLKSGFETVSHIANLSAKTKKEEEDVPNSNIASCRSQLVALALKQLGSAPDPLYIKVLASLIKIPPAVSDEERTLILRTCFNAIFQTGFADIPRIALKNLCYLLEEVLIQCATPAILDEIVSFLQPWLVHKSPYHRSAALLVLRSTLQCYQEHVKFTYEDASKFGHSGIILGTACIRSCETDLSIFTIALDCARIVLVVCSRFEGHSGGNDFELQESFSNLKNASPPELSITSETLSKMICNKLPHHQLGHLVLSLIDGLTDSEFLSSLGASQMLYRILSVKGGELYHSANEILDGILSALMKLTPGEVRGSIVTAVIEFGRHHPKILINTLLNQPIPFHPGVNEVWKGLASHPTLSSETLDQLVRLLSSSNLFEESPKHARDKTKIAIMAPLAVVSALQELFSVAVMGEIAESRFCELFSLLLVTLASYVGTLPPINTSVSTSRISSFIPNREVGKISPSKVALDCFKSFLLCTNCESAMNFLVDNSRPDLGESLPTAFIPLMPTLVRRVCAAKLHLVNDLVDSISQYANSNSEAQRIAVIAFLAECIGSCNSRTVDTVMALLLSSLNDSSPIVRCCSLKGLGSSFDHSANSMSKHGESVLSALTEGLDDNDAGEYPNIACSALTGLASVLPHLDSSLIIPVLVSLALRIKPFFEKDDVSVRSSAIKLFGELAKHEASKGSSQKNAFKEQVINSIVIFLLHLSEDEEPVIEACKYALYGSCPLLSIGELTELVEAQLGKDSSFDHEIFFVQTTEILVKSMPESMPMFVMTALMYCKSVWPSIRASAALFIGLIFRCLDSNSAGRVSIDSISAKLMMLLRDNDLNVRAQAAAALGWLIYD